MSKALPRGKGIYIWNLHRILGGDPVEQVKTLKAAGFNHVAIKIVAGITSFPYNWQEERSRKLNQAFIDECNRNGIEVWGWGYTYGIWGTYKQGRREAESTARIFSKYEGLAGYIIDAEHQYKKDGARAEAWIYSTTLRTLLPNVSIGLSSYRYPSYHPTFPWVQFLHICDFHYQQLYWLGSNNPRYQLMKSMTELKAKKDIPFIPAGSAYSEHGYTVTPEQIREFYDAVREFDLPGYSFWSFEHALRVPTWWAEIVSQELDPGPNDPPPVDCDDKIQKAFQEGEASAALDILDYLKEEYNVRRDG
jgi:hypothetical protein